MDKLTISDNAPQGILITFNHNQYVKLYYQGQFTKLSMIGIIKKKHKIIHNRRLNYLWSKIWVRQQEERMKDYEMIFENGRVLFVKKGENK